MSQLRIIPIPAFSDNYLWLIIDPERHGAAIVDPGDAAPVEAALKKYAVELQAIVITHHHLDHTGGVKTLTKKRDIPVFGPVSKEIPEINHSLAEGDQTRFLERDWQVIGVPGHTMDHIAYFHHEAENAPLLFCGDTLFASGCGRLFEGTPAMMCASLAKLGGLPADTLVHCAHEYTLSNLQFALAVEPNNLELQARWERDSARRANGKPTVPSLLSEELKTNPFLRCSQAAVIASAERRARRTLNTPVEVFAEVRAWKDQF